MNTLHQALGWSYQAIQSEIDRIETLLLKQGVDITKLTEPDAPAGKYPADWTPSPRILHQLYVRRDAVPENDS